MSTVAKILITPAVDAPGFMNVFARTGSAVARVAANNNYIGAAEYAAARAGVRWVPYVGTAIAVALTAYEVYQLVNGLSGGNWQKPTYGWGSSFACAGGSGFTPTGGQGTVGSASCVGPTVVDIWPSHVYKPAPAIADYYEVYGQKQTNPGTAFPMRYATIEYYARVATDAVPIPGRVWSPDLLANPEIDPNLNPRLNPQPAPVRFPEGDTLPYPTEQPSPGLEPQGEPGPVGNSEQDFFPNGEVKHSTNPNNWPRPRPESDPARERTKERKIRSKGVILFRILDNISESAEVVNSFYDTLPADVRKKWDKIGKESRKGVKGLADTAGQYGISNADWQLQALYYNWDKVDLIEALGNVAYNELEDKVVGNIAKRLPKTNGPLLKPVLDAYGKVSKQWREDFKDVILVGNR